MNFLNAFIFTFIYGKCFAKTCDSNAGFWSCKDGTATFQEDLFIKQYGNPGSIFFNCQSMDVSFDNDEDIKKVVFKADGAFCLKSIKGINIEEIRMSGKMLEI